MTLRDEFEKLCPVPEGVSLDANGNYEPDRPESYTLAMNHNTLYQGFLLGRQNTVSVEKYREDVRFALFEGIERYDEAIEDDWDLSQAKRRTEEV